MTPNPDPDPARRGRELVLRLARAHQLCRDNPGGPDGALYRMVRDRAAAAVRRHQARHGPITFVEGRAVWRLDPSSPTEDRPTGIVARLVGWLGGPCRCS